MISFKKVYFFLFIFIGVICAQIAHSKSSVWEVTSGKHHIYVGGTVHLLSPSDHPLPSSFDTAYDNAQILVFETDIEQSQSPAFQAKFLQAITFQDGRTLASSLPEETYKELSTFCEKRGLNIHQFATFTPSGISLMLVVMEYQRLGLLPQWGVDKTIHTKAIKHKKTIMAFETPQQQIDFIANIGKGKEKEMVEYTLRDIARMPEYIDTLKMAWRKGDLKSMEALGLHQIQTEFPKVYESLILSRNNHWLTKIDSMLKTKETEFILVGALHLAGKDGLISQKKKKKKKKKK